MNEESNRLSAVELEARENTLNIKNAVGRMDSHFHDQRQQNEKVVAILNSLPTAKDLEILQYKVLEQVNKIGALQRKDIEDSRAECKVDYEKLEEGHKKIEKRLDKVKWTVAGGLAVASVVVSIVVWVFEAVAK